MDNNSRIEYHVYIKIKGEWLNQRFRAHEHHPDDNFAISEEKAKYLAGKHGRVWKITTTFEQIYE